MNPKNVEKELTKSIEEAAQLRADLHEARTLRETKHFDLDDFTQKLLGHVETLISQLEITEYELTQHKRRLKHGLHDLQRHFHDSKHSKHLKESLNEITKSTDTL